MTPESRTLRSIVGTIEREGTDLAAVVMDVRRAPESDALVERVAVAPLADVRFVGPRIEVGVVLADGQRVGFERAVGETDAGLFKSRFLRDFAWILLVVGESRASYLQVDYGGRVLDRGLAPRGMWENLVKLFEGGTGQ
jgi:hypothetical protein